MQSKGIGEGAEEVEIAPQEANAATDNVTMMIISITFTIIVTVIFLILHDNLQQHVASLNQ